MITLDSSTALQVVLDINTTTNPILVSGSYIESKLVTTGGNENPASFSPKSFTASITASGATDVLAAPASGYIRQIKEVTVENADTAPHVLAVQINNGAAFTKERRSVDQDAKLEYQSGFGWKQPVETVTVGGGGDRYFAPDYFG